MNIVRRSAFFVLATVLSGCSSGPSITIDSTPHIGAPISFERTEKTHVAAFTAPTGGWGAERDRVRERFDVKQVFITLRRPASTAMVTQALVKHSVDTGVRLNENIEVFVREVSGRDPAQGAYRPAGAQKRGP